MMRTAGAKGRIVSLSLVFIALLGLVFYQAPLHHLLPDRSSAPPQQQPLPGRELLTGHAIAPKLANATAKAELGRAAWKVLHTTFGRFPEKPTEDEQEALRAYVHLFQRLYPCGECAAHFGKVLAKYPPQVSSRTAASMWGCFIHNVVNKRLKKPEFDCKNIGDAYDCGCGDEGKQAADAASTPA